MILFLLSLQSFTCTPARIKDGDTFTCRSGEIVRLADIDTPEVRTRCYAERILAIRARNRLAELLRRPFTLERSGRNRDRNGRLLRVVVQNGQSIGNQLVSEGLARTWTGRRLPWC